MITHLKETQYLEYKYRKQKFLLDLDYESLVSTSKDKILTRYTPLYIEKMDMIYKGILKNYSVKLADGMRAKKINAIQIYKNIFETLEDYIKNILYIAVEGRIDATNAAEAEGKIFAIKKENPEKPPGRKTAW